MMIQYRGTCAKCLAKASLFSLQDSTDALDELVLSSSGDTPQQRLCLVLLNGSVFYLFDII